MTEIILKDIELKNFKGVKNLKTEFNDGANVVKGANGTGKTTLVDAFNWLLFEKDSTGAAQFDIKTIDPSGEVKHKLDHEVTATLEINGQLVELKKTYKEDWKTKRGTTIEEFSGHTTDRYINGVPSKQKDYNAYIATLVDEEKFKLLTNPLYLAGMEWKKRRQLLWQLVDDVEDAEIFKKNPETKTLEKELKGAKAEELRDKYNYQRKNLEKDKADIPVRIDTLHEQIVEVEAESVNVHIRATRAGIDRVDEELQGLATNAITEDQQKAAALELEIKDLETKDELARREQAAELKKPIQEAELKLEELRRKEAATTRTLDSLNEQIDTIEDEQAPLRERYKELQKKEIHIDLDSVCPTCNRPFAEHELEGRTADLKAKANKLKAEEMEKLNARGLQLKARKEKLTAEAEDTVKALDALGAEIKETKGAHMAATQAFAEYAKADRPEPAQEEKAELEKLKKKINEAKNNNLQYNKMELIEKKGNLQRELETLNKKLWQVEQNIKTAETIKDLEAEEKELNIKLLETLAKLNAIEEYTRTKAELLEEKLNNKFTNVKVRLFNRQINGGIQEACDLLIDGYKPWSTASTGERIAAGVELTAALSAYYDIKAPLWIDNHESVTKDIKAKGQVIGLYADKAVKKLTIN